MSTDKAEITPLPPLDFKGNILFNVRGTNGSGKSYTMEKFMGDKGQKLTSRSGYRIDDYGTHCTLGKYETACGGLDTVREFASVVDMVRERIQNQHVMMEGVLWSTVFSSSYDLDKELRQGGHAMFWLFMDTSAMQCLRNVCRRRLNAGDSRPLDTDKIVAKIKGMNRSKQKAIDAGAMVRLGRSEDHQTFIHSCLEMPRDALDIHLTSLPIHNHVDIIIEGGIPTQMTEHIAKVEAKREAQANSLFDAFGG